MLVSHALHGRGRMEPARARKVKMGVVLILWVRIAVSLVWWLAG